MEITGIKVGHLAGSQKTERTSSKKDWKLSDFLREKITEYAREDAAQNVYMGNKFLALRKNEVAKVAPDRSALMGKLNQATANMKEIREADERWYYPENEMPGEAVQETGHNCLTEDDNGVFFMGAPKYSSVVPKG